MGHSSRIRQTRRAETIHRKKLFGGRETAMEVHRAGAWGNRPCTTCGGPPILRIVVLCPVMDYILKVHPVIIEMRKAANDGILPMMPSKFGPLIRMTNVYACSNCARSAEAAAARPPAGWRDSLIVDIDRGPEVERTMVAMPAYRKTAPPSARKKAAALALVLQKDKTKMDGLTDALLTHATIDADLTAEEKAELEVAIDDHIEADEPTTEALQREVITHPCVPLVDAADQFYPRKVECCGATITSEDDLCRCEATEGG